MELLEKNENDLKKAAKYLKEGEIIAFPTETVFGLGVKASSKDCFLKLVEVKNRRPDKPFTLMISDLKMVENIVEINETSRKIIEKFLPGELTIIMKAKENIPEYYSLNTGFIGVRMPNDNFILKLISEVNEPLLVPSCNPSDLKPAINYKEADAYFHDKIKAIVKGESISNVPSTVIKIDGDKITLLREGNIKFNKIEEVIK